MFLLFSRGKPEAKYRVLVSFEMYFNDVMYVQ
jgi:hypothetical protein